VTGHGNVVHLVDDLFPAHGSLTDVPDIADYEPPFSEADFPRLRFELEAAGSGLEVAGVVDAVFCEPAGWLPPCE
jgi:hypothetical protein